MNTKKKCEWCGEVTDNLVIAQTNWHVCSQCADHADQRVFLRVTEVVGMAPLHIPLDDEELLFPPVGPVTYVPVRLIRYHRAHVSTVEATALVDEQYNKYVYFEKFI